MNRTATTALGSLASLAVMTMAAAGPAAATPAGPAADVLCGTPAVDAVFETVYHEAEFDLVEHPAEFETIPATTHQEWKWTRKVNVPAHEYERTVTGQLVEWKRDAVMPVDFLWTRQVLQSAEVPAQDAVKRVTRTEVQVVSPAVIEYRFVHPNEPNEHANPGAGSGQKDKEHWDEDPNWNAQQNPNSIGWTLADDIRTKTPAVTETVEVVVEEGQEAITYVPAEYGTATMWSQERPDGEGWTKTDEKRPVTISGTELQLLPASVEPQGDGWYRTGNTSDGDTRVESDWFETDPGGDWVATGQQRPGDRVVTETTSGHSATAPGQEWKAVDGSESIVVDLAETEVQTKAAWTEEKQVKGSWTEQVKAKDAVPAGPECVITQEPPVAQPPVEEPPVVVTPPVIVPPVVIEPPVVVVPPVDNPVTNPDVQTPLTPIALGEEDVVEDDEESTDDKGQQAHEPPTTDPAVLGAEATATTVTAAATPTGSPVAVPTSVDAGLGSAFAAPAEGIDWRQAAGLFALAAGAALYAVPVRRRAEVR